MELQGRRLRLNETDSSTGSTVQEPCCHLSQEVSKAWGRVRPQDSDIENKPPGLDQEEARLTICFLYLHEFRGFTVSFPWGS